METIGGILGQLIAATNILVLSAAYGFVFFLRYQVKKKKVRQLKAERRNQMYLKIFGRLPEAHIRPSRENTLGSGSQREFSIKD